MLIGAKWTAWVGALVIVIGAGLLVKLGIDAGWWGRLSALTRCVLVAGFGVALIAGGELALRRISRAASAGLFGAGLGVLYLDALATTNYFDLVSQQGAFFLMAVVALGGFALTWRTRFVTIGVLSLLGGYLTPVLLGGASGHDLELLIYLTALFGIGLGLSAALPKPFRPLRSLALGGQIVIGLFWLGDAGSALWIAAVVFMSLWWVMLLAETLFAALRGQSSIGNAAAMLVATAAYVTGGCWIIGSSAPGGPDWLGLFTLAIALLGAATALQFGPGVEALRASPTDAIDRFSLALWAQSGVLLVVAAALQFDGYGQSISWLAVAVAAIEIGRRLPSRGVSIFGAIVGALAVTRIVLVDWWVTPALGNDLWSIEYIIINGWHVLLLFAIAATLAAAHRWWVKPNRPALLPPAITLVGAALWLLFCATAAMSHEVATLGWLLGCAMLLATERLGRTQQYAMIAVLMLAATTGKWLVIDALGAELGFRGAAESLAPVINWQLALAAAIVALTWWAGRVVARRTEAGDRSDRGAQSIVLAGALFLLLALSIEVHRTVDQLPVGSPMLVTYGETLLLALGWTALWGLGGGALMLAGRGPNRRLILTAGWTLLVLAGLAWLSLDTLGVRLTAGRLDATPILNLQFGAGALLGLLLTYAAVRWRRRAGAVEGIDEQAHLLSGFSWALVGVIGLWLGSFELERLFAGDWMAVQAALSVYWAIYGVGLVVIGFARRAAAARYAGLTLLTITVGKVLLIDLSTVGQVWRVASFLISGLLLVGTSLLYTRLSPRLLGERNADND